MARILLVDDDRCVRLMMRDALEARGHYVAQLDRSTHVAEAVVAHAPDVLILDLMMPDCNGADVLTGLRAWGATLPIILVSAYLGDATGPEWIERTANLGPVWFLAKPFSLDALLDLIAEALSGSAAAVVEC